ncbi:hypothetical protein OG440_15780 [Streptomyces sp. NBC_00637]|uniref:hypothetical protein n=1 Tax=Streptomyces sp. NBC_00637 TaxID=2903667 RepID=UPI0032548F3C
MRGRFLARVAVAWTGDPAEAEPLLAPLRAAAPVEFDTVAELDYRGVDEIYQDPQDPIPARESCALLREPTPAAVDTLLRQAGPDAGRDHPLLMVEPRHMGGAPAEPAAVEDAVCARDAAFLLESVGVLAGPEAAAAVEAATAALYTG